MHTRQPVVAQTVNVPVELDTVAPLGRVGVLALATDFNIEQDLRRMLPAGLEIFTNRIKNANPLSFDSLRAMTEDITRAAAGILPGFGVDAIIYGCTSGAIAIGSGKVEKLIHAAYPGIPVTNPMVSAQAAFEVLGASRISVLTPYTETMNAGVAEYLSDCGYDLINISGFGFDNDTEMTFISPQTIYEAALEVCSRRSDLLFISCTALRASLAVARIEKTLGVPVVTSNQALVWHILQLLGHCPPAVSPADDFGQLFTKHPSPKTPDSS